MSFPFSILGVITLPFQGEYLSTGKALVLYVLLAGPILWMGMRSMRGMDPAKKWTAIGVRLAGLWMLMLLLCGARWVRIGHDAEVIVLRDVSASISNWQGSGGRTAQETIDAFLKQSLKGKPARDKMGVVGFDEDALVDSLPGETLSVGSGHAIRRRNDGTDIAGALRLGMASFDPGTRKRLLLISDGNATEGDTESAVSAAAAAHIPVDVLKVPYEIQRDVVVEGLHSPTWVRQGETYTLDITVRWTGALTITGNLTLTRQGEAMDLDPNMPGVQPTLRVTLKPGINVFHVTVKPSGEDGINQFHATFSPDDPQNDALPGNNSADAFTFVRGKGKLLYVDNVAENGGEDLLMALRSSGDQLEVTRIGPGNFPKRLIDLEEYEAVILANVPRGVGGLTVSQDRLLAQYVRDFGGGLVVIGGPEALGAGGWQGSEIEKILPVELELPVERVLPAGALMLVLDCSGSMDEPMAGGRINKEQAAEQSAVLALRTLLPGDQLGVVAFNAQAQWVAPLAPNTDSQGVERKILSIRAGGGTQIYPALEMAYDALIRVPAQDASVRHILLLTDGESQGGDYAALLEKCNAAKISVSTVAVGPDADTKLLAWIASQGRGATYVVQTAGEMTQVFVKEARTLRRALIQEPADPISPVVYPEGGELLKGLGGENPPPISGMILTGRRRDPAVEMALASPGIEHDPILAYWPVGLGRVAVFTSDATRKWSAQWVASSRFGAFWSQLAKSVSRPPMSGEFEVHTIRQGSKTKLVVEGTGVQGEALNFYSFRGKIAGPNPQEPAKDIQLAQVGPGRYEAQLDTSEPGAYVAAVEYQGPKNKAGTLLVGVTVGAGTELNDLTSSDGLMDRIASQTGGRIYPSLGKAATSMDVFSRDDLPEAVSSEPIEDILILILLPIWIVDVAVRRIAWDRHTLWRSWERTAERIRAFTMSAGTPAVAGGSLAVLRQSRDTRKKETAAISIQPKRQFEVQTAESNEIVVQHIDRSSMPLKKQRSGNPLLEAKQRAQRKFKKYD
jgi:Mg-chelatase subunit ChlD